MMKWAVCGILAIGLLAMISLGNLGSFKRFEHRTITCMNQMIGPFELVVNKKKIGEFAQLTQPQGEEALEITGVSEGVIIAEAGDRNLRFTIDFEGAKVLVQENSKLRSSTCKTTDFSM